MQRACLPQLATEYYVWSQDHSSSTSARYRYLVPYIVWYHTMCSGMLFASAVRCWAFFLSSRATPQACPGGEPCIHIHHVFFHTVCNEATAVCRVGIAAAVVASRFIVA